jgi:hypothetical protein
VTKSVTTGTHLALLWWNKEKLHTRTFMKTPPSDQHPAPVSSPLSLLLSPIRLAWQLIYRLVRPVRSRTIKQPIGQPQPKPVPNHVYWEGVRLQLPGDGVGPLFHRRYWVDIAHPRQRAETVMAAIQHNVGAFAPKDLADFKKVKGHPDKLAVGDEFAIEILGPWNGAVRVIEVTPRSFAMVTLEGHPEAGQICFQIAASPIAPRALRFSILSWARSRDMLVSLTYHEGAVGKVVQENVWVAFCERVVEASGGEMLGEPNVVTEEREFTGEVVPVG